MWLVKKFKEKFNNFNLKWNINCKKWWKSWRVKILNMKKIILEKIQCILQWNYSFYGGLIFFILKILLWHIFWIHIFHFLNDKHSFIISKVHNETIVFFKFIHKFKILTKVYCNMDNEKFENFNVWYDFTF
jgi:hypothetical protein